MSSVFDKKVGDFNKKESSIPCKLRIEDSERLSESIGGKVIVLDNNYDPSNIIKSSILPWYDIPSEDKTTTAIREKIVQDSETIINSQSRYGSKNNSYFLSGSYYNQDGIIPTTGYEKATFRFNGEQKWKMLTFGASVAYSQANTDKTLTSAALYNSSGSGTMTGVYRWSPFDDMTHYVNEDGTRYRMFGDRLDVTEERDNPYWILNKNKLTGNSNCTEHSMNAIFLKLISYLDFKPKLYYFPFYVRFRLHGVLS